MGILSTNSGSSNSYTYAEPIKDESQYEIDKNKLNKTIEELYSDILALCSRLEKIQEPALSEIGVPNNGTPEKPQSQIICDLRMMTAKVEDITRKVNEINKRLQI